MMRADGYQVSTSTVERALRGVPDARRAGPGARRGRRYESGRRVWIRVDGAWRSGVVVAWFRGEDGWCCWVQHEHPEGRPWPVFEMYAYDPEAIVPCEPLLRCRDLRYAYLERRHDRRAPGR